MAPEPREATGELDESLSDLLSLRSSSTQINASLARIAKLLASIALSEASGGCAQSQADEHVRSEFLRSQDSFVHNAAARLIEFIARCLLRLQQHKYGEDYEAVFNQLGQTMKLVQGFLLLHSESRSLFGIPANMELLVTCLLLPDHAAGGPASKPSRTFSTPAAPSLTQSASPSLASIPFFFSSLFGPDSHDNLDPRHPGGTEDNVQEPPTLAEITLETTLCALVDRPENVKVLEDAGGVEAVVKILRGKVIAGEPAKLKALEFLYFYLFPQSASNCTAPLVQSPPLPRPSTPKDRQNENSPAMRAAERLPASGSATDVRLRAMLEATHAGWSPQTPSKPSRSFEGTRSALSRSVAAAAMLSPSSATRLGSSRRKRFSRVAFESDIDENDAYDSPRAKRVYNSAARSPSPSPVERRSHASTHSPRAAGTILKSVELLSSRAQSHHSSLLASSNPASPGPCNTLARSKPAILHSYAPASSPAGPSRRQVALDGCLAAEDDGGDKGAFRAPRCRDSTLEPGRYSGDALQPERGLLDNKLLRVCSPDPGGPHGRRGPNKFSENKRTGRAAKNASPDMTSSSTTPDLFLDCSPRASPASEHEKDNRYHQTSQALQDGVSAFARPALSPCSLYKMQQQQQHLASSSSQMPGSTGLTKGLFACSSLVPSPRPSRKGPASAASMLTSAASPGPAITGIIPGQGLLLERQGRSQVETWADPQDPKGHGDKCDNHHDKARQLLPVLPAEQDLALRRQAVLSRYLGNVDQLVERFDHLRKRSPPSRPVLV